MDTFKSIFGHFNGDLVPNCLLTRFPILFISPSYPLIPKWLQHLIVSWTSPWKKAAHYLRRHGYEVYKISDQELNGALQGTSPLKKGWPDGKRYHIVADRELSAKHLDFWSSHPKVVESLWTDSKFSTKVLENDWLIWAIRVAERDYLNGDEHERVEGQSSTMDTGPRS